jgi:hypothetical protein
MFDEINALAKENGLVLTCYVDDMTITGVGASRILPEMRKIVAAHGMRSHKVRLYQQGRPRTITGVVVTDKGLKLPNRRQLKIREQYHALNRAMSSEEKLTLLNPLISRLHEAAQIEPRVWLQKARELENIRRELRSTVSPAPDEPASHANSASGAEATSDV